MPEAERPWSGRLKYQEAKVANDGQVQEKAEHYCRGGMQTLDLSQTYLLFATYIMPVW